MASHLRLYYRTPYLSGPQKDTLAQRLNAHKSKFSPQLLSVETEYCFYVQSSRDLTSEEEDVLGWLLKETFEPDQFGTSSFLAGDDGYTILEVGPRMSFTTAWSSNATGICKACGLDSITRIERSRRFKLKLSQNPSEEEKNYFLTLVHDRMTECQYPEPLKTFETGAVPDKWHTIPVMEQGRKAMEEANEREGLAFDDWDLDFYTNLFRNDMKRDPTNVELFDMAQSNSEHSRHWFFGGNLVIDGKQLPETLMQIVKGPLKANPSNSVIAFKDNSSTIRGRKVETALPSEPGKPCSMRTTEVDYDILLTAETHNFPSGVAPFPGAETGTGGRIRDTHATGTGSLVVAGTAAYCVGNLNIEGYDLPWEDKTWAYPPNLAHPLDIAIQASNGASDYGNKFGEPVICGYARSFGLRLPSGERREWIKPIMFSGGIGQMSHEHAEKGKPEVGMLVVKIGGPAYRIGMGGGAASSMAHGDNKENLDFNAVQRGDAEMENKLNRVIRACVEMGKDNPVISIHDQGAGGSANVLKEITEPAGGVIEIRNIHVGDASLSVLEIWGAEYQEQDALLIRKEHKELFENICKREKCSVAFVGHITGDGMIVVHDTVDDTTPVNLSLEQVLGDMPRKTFEMNTVETPLLPLKLDCNVVDATDRVVRLLSVGSKRFLTNKVDRSVTGLIAQQQCVGPLQIPLADVAVIAQSHFDKSGKWSGAATSIGEQPIKGFVSAAAMGRLTVTEAITNLAMARITSLDDVKCSGNWMWAAKFEGEGVPMVRACQAMAAMMTELGIAVDGGKDSLSMAARVKKEDGTNEVVKSPGALVVSCYATCDDVTKVLTPNLKRTSGGSHLVHVRLTDGLRLGGSALAHVYGQVGDEAPDVEDAAKVKAAFNVVQSLIDSGEALSGHDISDGGLLVCALEMAFSGPCGVHLTLEKPQEPLSALFAEEPGWILEVESGKSDSVVSKFSSVGVAAAVVGRTEAKDEVVVSVGGQVVMQQSMTALRDAWEATSFELEMLQANPACVKQEKESLKKRKQPPFKLTFEPEPTPEAVMQRQDKPKVAIIREEGNNGDREMTSAFLHAGFDAWDVTMSDLLNGAISLEQFRGVAFVGGFSYADVLDSAKGWAGVIRFNSTLTKQFSDFFARPDTFSLGICNGCQLMALLGVVPFKAEEEKKQPRFVHNESGRFESRFAAVKVESSPAVMLKGMEGSTIGCWVANGEGRTMITDPDTLDVIKQKNLSPLYYVDDDNQATEAYPFNPSGSTSGIAGLCSDDGRHLALMPHPERAFLKWQMPWLPEDQRNLKASPWLKMFQNARAWCEN